MNLNYKNYLNLLNKDQKKVVEKTEGPCLVLAGAGSGKTRVLTYKILHLLIQKKAFPNQILAVTFTNKAASEMKNRVSSLLKQPIDRMWLGTFHSLSCKILRSHAELIGLKNNFIILDKDDQLQLIKKICEREKINIKDKTPKYYLSVIEGLKNKGIFFNALSSKKISSVDGKIYNLYQNELFRLNSVDFGDLILHCINIFKKNKNICLKYQNLFKYILVDEYQDINDVQQIWLEYLFQKNKNICCVGDDDQSIYSWRGANVKILLEFEKKFPNSKIFRLEQNYRSTQNILSCASTLISRNKGRYGKKIWSNNDIGDKIKVSGFWETKEEAKYISDEIEKIISKKENLSQIAILFRVSAHTRSFEERFINIGLPYKIIGGLRFYERKEIKDAIAYLRIVNNQVDDMAFERAILVPKRGIGKTTINKISKISRSEKISMFEAARNFVENSNSKIHNEINQFLLNILKWNNLKKNINHIDLAQIILEDSKYIEHFENEEKNLKNPENINRLENIKEFIESLKDFENLDGFLEHVGLVMENIENTNTETISLMTMHSAKGLEFNHVFLIGWEEGVFPSKKSIEEFGNLALEEERRLAYVALTRAKKNVLITFVNQNRYSYASHDFNQPSRFIEELPKDLIDIKNSNYIQNNNFIDDFAVSQEIDAEIISPGRKRLLANLQEKDLEWNFNQDTIEEKLITKGSKVFHQKFGYGKIIFIEGDKAEVAFKKSSQKKVLIKYLEFMS